MPAATNGTLLAIPNKIATNAGQRALLDLIRPMGKVTTHVLDTANGRPASGIRITVARVDGAVFDEIATAVTNHDGRVDMPLLEGGALSPGIYEIRFHVGAYFAGEMALSDPFAFLDVIPLRFGVSDPSAHYHVPLLVTPWSYSTYRGS